MQPGPEGLAADHGGLTMWEYRATLSPAAGAIHDGDTVRLLIDLGFDVRAEKWIRLAGVSAPEIGTAAGAEVRLFVHQWTTRRLGPNLMTGRKSPLTWPLRVLTEVTRRSEPTEVMTFARYVGWVYDLETGQCLNEAVNAFLTEKPE